MHIALGRSSEQGHGGHGHHVHHMPFTTEELMQFDLQHTIIYFRFGDSYPGMENPLDNWKSNKTGKSAITLIFAKILSREPGSSLSQIDRGFIVLSYTSANIPLLGLLRTTHFVTVVPTEYESGSLVVDTNQYSVTSHTDVVVPGGKHWHLPGTYFDLLR